MDYNEFAERIKTKYPEYKELDNKELAQRMISKYPEYNYVTFDNAREKEVKKGIDLTPGGLMKQIPRALATPIVAMGNKESLREAWEKTGRVLQQAEQEHPILLNSVPFATDVYVYSQLPVLRSAQGANLGAKAATFAGNATIQGGIPGALEGLKENNALEGAGVGTGIAAGLQSIPIVGKPIGQAIRKGIENPNFQKGLSKGLEIFTSVPSDYSKLALENELAGNSIFKGMFDADTAYQPIERKLQEAKGMLPTAEDFAEEYARLGDKAIVGMNAIKENAAQKINEALKKLDTNAIDINNLRNAVTSFINKEARGGNINNFLERAGSDVKDIYKKLGIKNKEQLTNELQNYYRQASLNPSDMEAQELGNFYNSILSDLTQQPNRYAQGEALKKIENSSFSDDAKAYLYEKFVNDVDNIDNIDNIINPKIKPIDLHNIKEGLYDKANYDTEKYGIRNTALKGMANQINNYIRKAVPAYAPPNDLYSLITNVERGLDSENTIAEKIANIGSKGNILSGLDQRLKNIDNLLPQQNKFYKQAKEIINSENEINHIKNTIGQQYERNPRLLANRTDETFENALEDLQKKTNINFMNDLNKTRAREAMEKIFPGQGGGSGSEQGFGNLVRTALIGGAPTAAAITHNPLALIGLGAISPKITAKGTIKNLGAIYRTAGKEIPESVRKVLTPLAVRGTVPMLYGGISNE